MGDTERALVGRNTPPKGTRAIAHPLVDEPTRPFAVPPTPTGIPPEAIAAHLDDVQIKLAAHVEARIDRRVQSLDRLLVELAQYKERTDELKSVVAATRKTLDETLDAMRILTSKLEWQATETKRLTDQQGALEKKIAELTGSLSSYESGSRVQFTAESAARGRSDEAIAKLERKIDDIEKKLTDVDGAHKQAATTVRTGYTVAKYIIGVLVFLAPYVYLLIKEYSTGK